MRAELAAPEFCPCLFPSPKVKPRASSRPTLGKVRQDLTRLTRDRGARPFRESKSKGRGLHVSTGKHCLKVILPTRGRGREQAWQRAIAPDHGVCFGGWRRSAC